MTEVFLSNHLPLRITQSSGTVVGTKVLSLILYRTIIDRQVIDDILRLLYVLLNVL